MSYERKTAYICTINEIASAPFIKLEGLESSYLITEYGNCSRVNVIGVVVGIDQNTTTLDDGSGRISLRSFEPLKHIPEIGELVMVIGKPRVFNNEKFIVPEIIKKLENHKWVDYRKRELGLRKKIQDPEKVEIPKREIDEFSDIKGIKEEVKTETPVKKENAAEKIIRTIREKDTGKGVSITDLEALQIDKFDQLITTMLEEGDIYEIRSGYVKVLD